MKKRSTSWLCLPAILLVTNLSAETYFQQGNKAYAEERYRDAVNLYQQAVATSPSSAEMYFNLGTAQYRTGNYDAAMKSFEYAGSMANTDQMRSIAFYNLGNCMVQLSETLRESDPHAAAGFCRQAVWLYRTALSHNLDFIDAAYNLEIAQRMVFAIDKKIREQEQKAQQENKLISDIRKKLTEYVARQSSLLESKINGEPQQVLRNDTMGLATLIKTSKLHEVIPSPDGTQSPGPLKETLKHTEAAAAAMAIPDQSTALAELIAALGSMPEDPNQKDGESDEDSEDYEEYDMDYEASDEEAQVYKEADPFGDFSDYEEIRGVPPPNQTETDILAEEVRNQERRKEKKSGEYKAVGKDW